MCRLMSWSIVVCALAALTPYFVATWISRDESPLKDENNEDTLVLLHVLFRHGDRTPDASEIYPKDPYATSDFPPYGLGELTKEGKRREYSIGKWLRQKYDRFLGLYGPESVAAKSTDYSRTRMSCLLVLAGLYPPTNEQLWEEGILWQPIPYDASPNKEDKVLGDPMKFCAAFKKEYQQHLLSPDIEKVYNRNKEVYDYLSENTGLVVKTPNRAYDLYFVLKAEEELGLKLPEWTKSVWPENITLLAAEEYDAQANSLKAQRVAAGYFLEKVIGDTDLKIKSQLPPARKIFLYSAHEYNLAFLLKVLGVFQPHVPPFGAYLTLEVHKINETYGFKILYQDYEEPASEPKVLKLPECDAICSIDKFKKITERYIPLPNDCEV